jgi:enterochelin esterase family protein
MPSTRSLSRTTVSTIAAALALTPLLLAQQPAPAAPPQGGGRGGTPAVVSPEVSADRMVVFRLNAPQAQSVRVTGGDMPALAGGGRGAADGTPPRGQMTKGENGVWSVTLGPIDPGAYRYNFNVDGVTVIDPRNSSISESNTNVWSLVYVPGSDVMDTKQVPHGAVAAVTYYSTALSRFRRMHVYTPPGYEAGGSQKYPIFYLLHGAGDCDEAWTSVGRAGFIFDNLIAAKKIKPMVVVMPAGHTNTATPAGAPLDDFARDFLTDVMPYAEKNYRVMADRAHRAIAGLSMGGSQTLNVAFHRLEQFAYIGVFSSGATLGGGRGAAAPPATAPAAAPGPTAWETAHLADLDNPSLKKGTKLVWLSTGVTDGLMPNTRNTVEMLKQHGFAPVFKESPGGHTWINWRNYLAEFAPLLFQ